MAASVVVKDKGKAALMKRLAEKAKAVTVGIHEDVGSAQHPNSDLTIAELGAVHELGLGVPERSFIRAWADETESEQKTALRKIGEAVVKGTVPSLGVGLDRFGVHAVGQVQARIRDGIDPPLEDATVAAKGSETPLIDEGTLWTSVKHKVEEQ